MLPVLMMAAFAPLQGSPGSASLGVEVAFSPGDAEAVVVGVIGEAKTSIRMAAYSFTSPKVAKALVDAKMRGVDVRAVLDKSQKTDRYSGCTFLVNKGVPVRINARYAIMHNKFLVIDGSTLETGSFNFTSSAAKRNAENVIVLRNAPEVAAKYAKEWERLWTESEPSSTTPEFQGLRDVGPM